MEIVEIYLICMSSAAQPDTLQAYAQSCGAAEDFCFVGGCVCRTRLNDDAMAKTLRLLLLYVKPKHSKAK